jgi:hypothetical protein
MRGFDMETGHTETVVGKAVAYVKDMFGIPPGEKSLHGETERSLETAPSDAGPLSEHAMSLEANAYTFKTVAEVSAERARYQDGD